MSETLESQLGDLLDQRRWSNYKLHQVTGVPYGTIGRLRRNLLTQMSFQNIAKICLALDITPGELFYVARDPS